MPSGAGVDRLTAEQLKQKPSMQTGEGLLRRRGQLDPKSSIFSNIDDLSKPSEETVPYTPPPVSEDERLPQGVRNLEIMGRVLDPRPSVREGWQRRMIIRSIRRRGRLTRTETLLRTERSSLSKSHFFKTSVKKLMMLARQIAGKDLDEAMLQMRFSKKKAAREVLAHLKHAKNEAIVRRGMGLGPNSPYIREAEESSHAPPKEKAPEDEDILGKVSKAQNPRTVYPMPETPMWKPKDHHPDLTKMYVSQAWVGRGTYSKTLDHRARGVVNIMRNPHTSISVLLKEEKTRAREAKEKAAREWKKRVTKVWTQLPDRPITTQRPYYTF
jgi:ribosomal protein L22